LDSKNSESIARSARITALKMVAAAKASHIGSSLSVIDILVVLYSISQNVGEAHSSDFILVSKGHAAAGVYSVLKEFSLLSQTDIDNYCKDGAKLGGHVTSTNVPSLTFSTGSLGHALPFAVGIALGKNLKALPGKVYVVLSDGELNEGSNWEAILAAANFNLSNLIVIIDRNRLQSLRSTEETMKLDPLPNKFKAFNWEVLEINGHDHSALKKEFDTLRDAPTVIIANTIKGKGVSFMENSVAWHYKYPNESELMIAIEELEK
jgi:transketolase